MTYKLPHTITNCIGETLTFERIERTPEGDRVIVRSCCKPGAGPIMHTHFKQDEALTVVSGTIGYQVQGEEPRFAGPGETIEFKRGMPHRFWAEGPEDLHCTGWVSPANTIIYYLTAIYAAQNKAGTAQPERFDGAYLIKRYAAEYDLPELPRFVKKVIIPATYYVGKWLGKYKHFKDAPQPLEA